ncbi:hypothetical protein BC828DRAFT_378300 [Blastocladiella britannica]|nr:hypothetical protein BC828DRAFT_378300 [Blastocladiella britannica]
MQANDTQVKTFTKWVNAKLRVAGAPQISTLSSDFRDGLRLLDLVRALAPPANPLDLAPERSSMRIHHILNVGKAFNHVVRATGTPLVMIGAEDIVDGNEKLILGFVWTLIVRFQLAKIAAAVATPLPNADKALPPVPDVDDQNAGDVTARAAEDDAAPASAAAATTTAEETALSPAPRALPNDPASSLLRWVRSTLAPYASLVDSALPSDFSASWCDGKGFLLLAHACAPDGASDAATVAADLAADGDDARARLARAFDLAEHLVGVPALLDPEDLLDVAAVDDKSVMTYVATFATPPTPAPVPVTHAAPTVRELHPRLSSLSLASHTSSSGDSTPLLGPRGSPPASAMTLAARDLVKVAGDASGLRRAVKRVALDYPDLAARSAALAAAQQRRIAYAEDLTRAVETHGSSDVLEAAGETVAVSAEKKARVYLEEVEALIRRAGHQIAVERLVQDFFDDCTACAAWIGDSALALAVQSRKATALTLPTSPTPTSLAAYANAAGELHRWSAVMANHLAEFAETLAALREAAANIRAHGESAPARYAETVKGVDERETEVVAKYDALAHEFGVCRMRIDRADHLAAAARELAAAREKADVLIAQVTSALDGAQGVEAVQRVADDYSAGLDAAAGLAAAWARGSSQDASETASSSSAVSRLLATTVDAAADPESATEHAAFSALVTLLATDLARIRDRLQSAATSARTDLVMHDLKAASQYTATTRATIAALAWAIPTDSLTESSSLLETDAPAALAARAAEVQTLAAQLASYETRVIKKLVSRVAQGATDENAEITRLAAEVADAWAEAGREFAAVQQQHNRMAWVADAVRSLAHCESRLAGAADALAIHAGKRRSVLRLSAMVAFSSTGELDVSALNHGGSPPLPDLELTKQSLADVSVDLDAVLAEYPDLPEMPVLAAQQARLVEKLAKASRIVETLSQRRAAAQRSEHTATILSNVVTTLMDAQARLGMAAADLAAVADPLDSSSSTSTESATEPATADTQDTVAEARSVLQTARDAVRSAADQLATVHSSPKAEDVRVLTLDEKANALITQVSDQIGNVAQVLESLTDKRARVKAASDTLDAIERLLRKVDVPSVDDAGANVVALAAANLDALAKADELFHSHPTSSLPAVVHARRAALDAVHGLLSRYFTLTADLARAVMDVPLHMSLEENGNAEMPTRDDHARLVTATDDLAADSAATSERVSEWMAELHAFLGVVSVTATAADAVTIFAPALGAARDRVMQTTMDADDALDRRTAALGLVLRVVETHEQGLALLAKFSAPEGDEATSTGETTLAGEVSGWRDGSADLRPLFVPLQSLDADLLQAMTAMKDRAAARLRTVAASDRLRQITAHELPALRATIVQARTAVPHDMYSVEGATVRLLQSAAAQAEHAISALLVELIDDRFAPLATELASVRTALATVQRDHVQLLETAELASAFQTVAADAHVLTVRTQVLLDSISRSQSSSPSSADAAFDAATTDYESLAHDVAAFKAVHASKLDGSFKLRSAVETADETLAKAKAALERAEHERTLRSLARVFEVRAGELAGVLSHIQADLNARISGRRTGSPAEDKATGLEALANIGAQLAQLKLDVDALPLLGSSQPDLAASPTHVKDLLDREKSLLLSFTAVTELHAAATVAMEQEQKVEGWTLRCAAATSTLSALLEEYKRLVVHIDAVDTAASALAVLQDGLDAVLADVAVLKTEGHGDATTMSTLAVLLGRKAAVVQQQVAECKRIQGVANAATVLTEQIEQCASVVPTMESLEDMTATETQVAEFETTLRDLVEHEAEYVISSEENADLVRMLFSELQRSLSALMGGVSGRRKHIVQAAAVASLRSLANDLTARIHAAVQLPDVDPMTRDNFAAVAQQGDAVVNDAMTALDGLREPYDNVTVEANRALAKVHNASPLQGILAQLGAEWTKARELVKARTEVQGAISSLSELFARVQRISAEIDRVAEVVASVRTDTTEGGMALVQQAARDFAALKDNVAVVLTVFAKLADAHAVVMEPHAPGFRVFAEDVQARAGATQTALSATQSALFKASQLLATCAEMQQQCEAILETADERQQTLANDLFYSMELVDAELFVKAALTVHQNATGDLVRLRAARDRMPSVAESSQPTAEDLISQSFKDRLTTALADVDAAFARMDAAAKREADQIELLKRVYSHMRATNQILVWLTAAKGAMSTLTTPGAGGAAAARSGVVQLSAVEEIRGKMINFAPTIDMYDGMAKELADRIDHPVIRQRTDRVLAEWGDLNARVELMAKLAVEATLVIEFHALCDEMEDVMQMFRREIQSASRDAEQVENEDEHEEMTRKLRQYSALITETLDPQVDRLQEIIESDQVTPDVVVQEDLRARHEFVVSQVASLQELVVQRLDLIQATQQTRAAFEIFADISKLMASTQSLLDEIKVDQVALLDIERTVAALQQRHANYANNIQRLFEMVNRLPLREQVVARRDLLLQQWDYVGQDVTQVVRDLELRKKLLLARMEREREEMQSAMAYRSSATKSPGPVAPSTPGLSVRSFLPRPSSPGAPLRLANASQLPTPPTSGRSMTPGLRPKTPPTTISRSSAGAGSGYSSSRTPPPPLPSSTPLPRAHSVMGGSGGYMRSPTPRAPSSGHNNGHQVGMLVSSRGSMVGAPTLQYRADKSDPIDKRIGEIIAELGGMLVKLKRQAPGKYVFGEIEGKLINCKLVNQNVVVRVGGGWKDFRDYILEMDVAGLMVKSETVTASRIEFSGHHGEW